MREIALVFANYSLFIVLHTALSGMQASLWLHIFGLFPAPLLWLTVLNYWALYRSLYEAIVMTYFVTFIFITMSGIPLQMAYAVNLSLFGTVYLMRDRILWSGPNSFMLSCGISAFLTPIFTFIWSHIFEDRAAQDFQFFNWVMSSVLTAAVSLPLYYLFTWADRLTQKEPPKETESGVL